ncbi:MAG TPA: hypothetical protein GX505_03005 [Clostridiales bacterium]|nr:hypothetical protein [Clostridiales bacterium]
MEMLDALLHITLGLLLLRIVMSIITGILINKKMQQIQKNNASILEILYDQKVIQRNEAMNDEIVRDDYCGKMIEKRKAYIVSSGDHKNYFCSWECREKFIKETG